MKQLALFFILTILLFCSCALSIKSVSDKSLREKNYRNPLIAIPFVDPVAEPYTNKLKEYMENLFKADKKAAEIFVYGQKQEGLMLNATQAIDSVMNRRIADDKKDVIIVFRTKTIKIVSGTIQSITYMIAAVDAHTGKEMWKAEIDYSSIYTVNAFGREMSKAVYEKLKSDKVL